MTTEGHYCNKTYSKCTSRWTPWTHSVVG